MLSNNYELITNFEMPSEWIYRGEGNCNVVLSLPKLRKILRIRKIDRPQSFIGWLIVWISDFLYWYCGKGIKEELRDLKFYSVIMRPLIGRKYTSVANQVILTRQQVKMLENNLSKFRPDFRKNKILQYGRAAMFDDFALLPENEYQHLPFKLSNNTFSVEIKPKQGWKPLSEKHLPKCLFCMNQYFKMEKNQVKDLSNYCPEDLFSGDEIKMKYAIKSLSEIPQNNFRLFKNGNKVDFEFYQYFSDLFEIASETVERLQEEFYELIKNCLLKNLSTMDSAEDCKDKLFCEWNKIIQNSNLTNVLPKGCVLEKILSVQMLDTEGSHYYNKFLSKEDLKDWRYVNMLLNKVENKNVCLKCMIMMLGNTDRHSTDMDLTFVPYLISAIAKDCSLMITLRKIKEDNCDNLDMKNIIKTKYGHFLINIGVFDLYPKPLSTIRKHCKRNKDIFQAYKRATS